MADGLVDTGIISKRLCKGCKCYFHCKVVNYNPVDAICVTTAAMSEKASTIKKFKYFKEISGTDFSIIDGNEEIRLTFVCEICTKKRNINSNKFVLLDIGGGSTEIIVNTNEKYDAI